MTESLGLSIGVANLVAARVGSAAVSRKSVLTIFDNRAGEVGLPEENPNLNEPGLVMRGFVERVGDGSPLVAADGTKYLGEALTVEALEAMARTVGYGTPIAIAIPAYWSERQSAALRDEFFAQPALAPNGVPPLLISDATAALTALRTRPGVPDERRRRPVRLRRRRHQHHPEQRRVELSAGRLVRPLRRLLRRRDRSADRKSLAGERLRRRYEHRHGRHRTNGVAGAPAR